MFPVAVRDRQSARGQFYFLLKIDGPLTAFQVPIPSPIAPARRHVAHSRRPNAAKAGLVGQGPLTPVLHTLTTLDDGQTGTRRSRNDRVQGSHRYGLECTEGDPRH
jgi:hypothetical protein